MLLIHDRPGSFSDRWIAYASGRGIPFRRVDCLASDFLVACAGANGLLWHWSHDHPGERLVARAVIAAAEARGILVFPSSDTCWHYDDKIAQKHLLEAIGAPIIPTWIFTDAQAAKEWIAGATWPKVFKLRCGAGSANVRRVSSRRQARWLCRRAFGGGFSAKASYWHDLKTRIRKTGSLGALGRKIPQMPKTIRLHVRGRRLSPPEKGYLYFQEFLQGNAFDTRITVIGDRAFAFRRDNRSGDFRASGSGLIRYDPGLIDERCVEIAFATARRIGAQSLALDFLLDAAKNPRLVEISYCFSASAVYACPGYWDGRNSWRDGHVWPEEAIIEDMLAALGRRTD
jgi:hypothetical protein